MGRMRSRKGGWLFIVRFATMDPEVFGVFEFRIILRTIKESVWLSFKDSRLTLVCALAPPLKNET
jgi:hypothetical protein